MVKNIVIVGLDRDITRPVAEILAEQLQMHFLDTIELFEFDHIPRSLSEILVEQKEKYYRKKEVNIMRYASGFENTVIHSESGFVLEEDTTKIIKQNCLLIYLYLPAKRVKENISKKVYKDDAIRRFFNISLAKIEKRHEILNKCCDIKVNVADKSVLKIVSGLIRAMDKYFTF